MDEDRIAAQVNAQLGLVRRWRSRTELEAAIADLAHSRGVAPGQAVEALERGEREYVRDLAAKFTVDESFFLRHPEHFEVLRQRIVERSVLHPSSEPLRILCLGCAKGEEPYSAASVIVETLGSAPFAEPPITAVDINPVSLAAARAGIYGAWSLREVPAKFIERHLEAVAPGRWSVRPELRRLVRLERSGAQEYIARCAPSSFDAVFFRNVAVYFSVEACQRFYSDIRGLLRPHGMLVLAPTDPMPHRHILRSRANGPPSVLYGAGLTDLPSEARRHSRSARYAARGSMAPSILPRPRRDAKANAPEGHSEEDEALLLRANRLGDQGHDDAALSVLEELLGRHPRYKAALWLRGKLHMARDDAQTAAADFEQALSVDPDDAVVRYWLSLAMLAQGRVAQSLAQLDRLEASLRGKSEDELLADSETRVGELRSAAAALRRTVS